MDVVAIEVGVEAIGISEAEVAGPMLMTEMLDNLEVVLETGCGIVMLVMIDHEIMKETRDDARRIKGTRRMNGTENLIDTERMRLSNGQTRGTRVGAIPALPLRTP